MSAQFQKKPAMTDSTVKSGLHVEAPQALADDELAEALSMDPREISLDNGPSKNGLAQLVLVLVKLLHEVIEKQAIRRMDAGTLTNDQIERIGLTLMQQADALDRMREVFGLEPEDLDFDLSSLVRVE